MSIDSGLSTLSRAIQFLSDTGLVGILLIVIAALIGLNVWTLSEIRSHDRSHEIHRAREQEVAKQVGQWGTRLEELARDRIETGQKVAIFLEKIRRVEALAMGIDQRQQYFSERLNTLLMFAGGGLRNRAPRVQPGDPQ